MKRRLTERYGEPYKFWEIVTMWSSCRTDFYQYDFIVWSRHFVLKINKNEIILIPQCFGSTFFILPEVVFALPNLARMYGSRRAVDALKSNVLIAVREAFYLKWTEIAPISQDYTKSSFRQDMLFIWTDAE